MRQGSSGQKGGRRRSVPAAPHARLSPSPADARCVRSPPCLAHQHCAPFQGPHLEPVDEWHEEVALQPALVQRVGVAVGGRHQHQPAVPQPAGSSGGSARGCRVGGEPPRPGRCPLRRPTATHHSHPACRPAAPQAHLPNRRCRIMASATSVTKNSSRHSTCDWGDEGRGGRHGHEVWYLGAACHSRP